MEQYSVSSPCYNNKLTLNYEYIIKLISKVNNTLSEKKSINIHESNFNENTEETIVKSIATNNQIDQKILKKLICWRCCCISDETSNEGTVNISN